MSTNNICPVCGATRAPNAGSSYTCCGCGFKLAFVDRFADRQSYELWQSRAKEAKGRIIAGHRRETAAGDNFIFGSSAIVFRSLKSSEAYIVSGNGSFSKEENVASVSVGERNIAVAYLNGKVKVFGDDNGFGQKNTESWTDVRSVLTCANCTYGITSQGGIICAGSPVSKDVAYWKGITRLRCSTNAAAGLDSSKSIRIAGDAPYASKISGGVSYEDMALSKDCLIALASDGSVYCYGQEGAISSCAGWKNIIAVTADNVFAYGLTENGEMKVAGQCKAFLDKGRSKSAEWKGLIAISANRSGIAGITEEGELLLAGTVTGDKDKMISSWNANVKNVVISAFL